MINFECFDYNLINKKEILATHLGDYDFMSAFGTACKYNDFDFVKYSKKRLLKIIVKWLDTDCNFIFNGLVSAFEYENKEIINFLLYEVQVDKPLKYNLELRLGRRSKELKKLLQKRDLYYNLNKGLKFNKKDTKIVKI